MEESSKVAIGRFVMRNKQYLAALRAVDGNLLMSTMVFADEVVSLSSIDELERLDEVEVTSKEVKMAEALVDSLSAAFEPEKYQDAYREQVLDLIERKAAGETFETSAEEPPAPPVVDLMAALEASVKAAKEARKRHPSKAPSKVPASTAAAKKKSA
jgi:DNA end-binding protein Ku